MLPWRTTSTAGYVLTQHCMILFWLTDLGPDLTYLFARVVLLSNRPDFAT